MRNIYKYEVVIDDQFEVSLPRNAVFLSVQLQHGVPQMWWLVDPNVAAHPRKFRVRGTGHQFQENPHETEAHLGTFQMNNGNLVWHLFDVRARGA